MAGKMVTSGSACSRMIKVQQGNIGPKQDKTSCAVPNITSLSYVKTHFKSPASFSFDCNTPLSLGLLPFLVSSSPRLAGIHGSSVSTILRAPTQSRLHTMTPLSVKQRYLWHLAFSLESKSTRTYFFLIHFLIDIYWAVHFFLLPSHLLIVSLCLCCWGYI